VQASILESIRRLGLVDQVAFTLTDGESGVLVELRTDVSLSLGDERLRMLTREISGLAGVERVILELSPAPRL
jgi:hypothetical protein